MREGQRDPASSLTLRINAMLRPGTHVPLTILSPRGDKLNARKKTGTVVAYTDIRDRESSKEFIKLI